MKLRHRLRELAGMHVRYGYRRLAVLLRREGWHVNAKRIYRLYRDEGLIVRTKQRRKMARRRPVAIGIAARPNQCWSMNFVSDKLADGRSFRILTVVDQFTRECVGLEADRSMTGMKVAQALEHARHERGQLPESITVDNGSEFCSRALEAWAMTNDVQLCFIQPGRPVENGFIESFNGRLRDECSNVEWFASLDGARRKLAKFRQHYNRERPHSSLTDRTPAAFAALHQTLYHWQRLAGEQRTDVTATSPVRELRQEVRDLKRLLGEKTLEVDFFSRDRTAGIFARACMATLPLSVARSRERRDCVSR